MLIVRAFELTARLACVLVHFRGAEWQQESRWPADRRPGQHRPGPGDCAVPAARPWRLDRRHVRDAHHHWHRLRH